MVGSYAPTRSAQRTACRNCPEGQKKRAVLPDENGKAWRLCATCAKAAGTYFARQQCRDCPEGDKKIASFEDENGKLSQLCAACAKAAGTYALRKPCSRCPEGDKTTAKFPDETGKALQLCTECAKAAGTYVLRIDFPCRDCPEDGKRNAKFPDEAGTPNQLCGHCSRAANKRLELPPAPAPPGSLEARRQALEEIREIEQQQRFVCVDLEEAITLEEVTRSAAAEVPDDVSTAGAAAADTPATSCSPTCSSSAGSSAASSASSIGDSGLLLTHIDRPMRWRCKHGHVFRGWLKHIKLWCRNRDCPMCEVLCAAGEVAVVHGNRAISAHFVANGLEAIDHIIKAQPVRYGLGACARSAKPVSVPCLSATSHSTNASSNPTRVSRSPSLAASGLRVRSLKASHAVPAVSGLGDRRRRA